MTDAPAFNPSSTLKYLDGGRIIGLARERPAPTTAQTAEAFTGYSLAVEKGSEFIAIDTGERSVSDGVAWQHKPYESIASALGYDQRNIRTRWVQWFTGITWDTSDQWSYTNVDGSNSFAYADEANGGLQITTAGSDSNSIVFHWNGKRDYSPTSSVIICVFRSITANTCGAMGLEYNSGSPFHNTTQHAVVRNWVETNYALNTGANSGYSSLESDLPSDTQAHVHKIQLRNSCVDLYIDGVHACSKTNDLPYDTTLQPRFGAQKRSGGGTGKVQFRYLEAFNY